MKARMWIAVMSAAVGGCGAVTGLDGLRLGTGGAPASGGASTGHGTSSGTTSTSGSDEAPASSSSTSSSSAGGAPVSSGSTSSGAAGSAGSGSTASSGGGACSPVSGLLAYYPLDGDTLDHSGNGNDAIGENLTPAPGKIGGAYTFDGAHSSLQATGSAMLGGARTLCAWVDPSPSPGLGQPIFSGGKPQQGDFFAISASSPSGGTCAFLSPEVLFIDHWGTPCYTAEGPALSPSAWHFVCYVYDGTGALTLYGDGNVESTNGAEYAYSLDTLFIGSATIGGTTTQPSLLGTLDEVTVWSRALDAGDLAKLWNGGAGCAAR